MRTRGVLALEAAEPRLLLVPEQRQPARDLAAQTAIALERVHYVEVAQQATVQIESERLRNSLLGALSHDLRTPLAGLSALAETLRLTEPRWPRAGRHRAGACRRGAAPEHAGNNLLDMARIESGAVKLRARMALDRGGRRRRPARRRARRLSAPRSSRPTAGRPAAGRIRCGADRAGARQPARERRQVHAAPAHDQHLGQADGGALRVRSRDHGPGIRAGRGGRRSSRSSRAATRESATPASASAWRSARRSSRPTAARSRRNRRAAARRSASRCRSARRRCRRRRADAAAAHERAAAGVAAGRGRPQIRRFLRTALEAEGWQRVRGRDGARRPGRRRQRKPDLVIARSRPARRRRRRADPDLRAWSTCRSSCSRPAPRRATRSRRSTPAPTTTSTKPFGVGELLARVRAQPAPAAAARRRRADPVFRFGDVRSTCAPMVRRAAREVHLTPIEFQLLSVLIANAGRVLTHRQLLREVWGPSPSSTATT